MGTGRQQSVLHLFLLASLSFIKQEFNVCVS